jgi:hypothetical protein
MGAEGFRRAPMMKEKKLNGGVAILLKKIAFG